MSTSRIPTAIDGLLALCNAQTGTGGTLAAVRVYDGPPVIAPDDELQLYIGYDEERATSETPSVEGTQVWQTMGGARSEDFSILCCVIARSGNTVIKTERDRAYVVLAAVENLIRLNVVGADHTLGGSVLTSHIAGAEKLLQLQTTDGAYVKVTFHVECIARI